jgi:nitroreductase
MENIYNSILNRRSIRKYTDQKVSGDLIKELLKAAMSAPSACNQQPWHYIVIESKDVLGEISMIHSGFSLVKDSSLLILVCGEPEKTQLEFFWRQDCSAATENILIAAQSQGLGAIWLGINPNGGSDTDILRNTLSIPEYIVPFSLVCIGYPAEEKEPSDRFDEGKVHYNSRW